MKKYGMLKASRLGALSAGLTLALAASGGCGGDDDKKECGVGEHCECSLTSPCPNPMVETCSMPVFGQPGTCEPIETGDTSDEPDATTDIGEDPTVDTDTSDEPDATDEPDTTDVPDEEVVDVDECDGADCIDVPDDPPIEIGPDDPPVDTDVPVSSNYEAWVAYTENTSGTNDRAVLVSSDRALGPFTLPGPDATIWRTKDPAFTPDGTHVVYVVIDATGTWIRVLELATGEFEDVLTGNQFTALRYPVVSPDGSQLVFGGKRASDPDVWNVFTAGLDGSNVTARTDVVQAEQTSRFVSSATWSSDGTEIFYITGIPGTSADVWRKALSDGATEQVTFGANSTSVAIAARANGQEILIDIGGTLTRVGVDPDATTSPLYTETVPTALSANGGGACAYYGDADRLICSRLQLASGGDCDTPSSDCILDIATVDMSSSATLLNITQTPAARESTPNATVQAYTDLPASLD
ncbi:MAG: hypothetical protein H6700_12735 [Myxococcales bacterium]|nr:hypothetical protein [Myxococcales bacterium]MCB9520961.1 hypothetical protein [Myxococcales bacterium]MCB9532626.1 hypothetical protein [Myxococcales bacterium]